MGSQELLRFLKIRVREMRKERDGISIGVLDTQKMRRRSYLSGRLEGFKAIADIFFEEKI